ATRKALLLPAIGVVAAVALVAASRILAPAVSRFASRAATPPPATLGVLNVGVRVPPPAYSRRRAESVQNPPVIRALVGSDVRVTVASRDSVIVNAGETRVPAGAPWRVGTQPVAIRVLSGGSSGLIPVDPVPDSAPVVQLREPVRDTVLATPSGTFTLGADL